MSDLSPGQDVRVSGASGGAARVIYVRGNSVRVRILATGKERTVELDRVTAAPVSKSLSVGPLTDLMDMANVDESTAKRIVAACVQSAPLRPCPKPVTPKRESKALTISEMAMQWNDAPGMTSRSDERRRAVLRGEPLPTFGASRPVPKPVTLYSEPYLAYVRKHPCCLCGTPGPSEAHHWSHHGGVMGRKVDDYRTVPLCQEHHRYWHDHGTLPEMDREHSEAALLREQAWLLRAWLDNNTVHYGDQVDALIRAIGGADA